MGWKAFYEKLFFRNEMSFYDLKFTEYAPIPHMGELP